jgi:hypothetical protein
MIMAEAALQPPLSPLQEDPVGYPSMPEDGSGLQPAVPSHEIVLPAPRLTTPTEPEWQFPVSCRDWERLRGSIISLSHASINFANAGWACIGIAAGAVAAYLPWAAAYSQLTLRAQQHYAFISPLLSILAIASSVVSILSFFANKKAAQIKRELAENILADMDSITRLYPTIGSKDPPPLLDAQAPNSGAN